MSCKAIFKHLSILTIITFYSCNDANEKKVEDPKKSSLDSAIDRINSRDTETTNTEINESDCVDFAAMWSAEDISKAIGKNKKWVFLNYRFDLWDQPPSLADATVVGKIRVQSYGQILDRTDKEYLVRTPSGDKGWVLKEHVKTISKKSIVTGALCD